MLKDDYKAQGAMLEALEWNDGPGAEQLVLDLLDGRLPEITTPKHAKRSASKVAAENQLKPKENKKDLKKEPSTPIKTPKKRPRMASPDPKAGRVGPQPYTPRR